MTDGSGVTADGPRAFVIKRAGGPDAGAGTCRNTSRSTAGSGRATARPIVVEHRLHRRRCGCDATTACRTKSARPRAEGPTWRVTGSAHRSSTITCRYLENHRFVDRVAQDQ